MKKRLTMFLAALFLCMGTAMAQTKVSGTVFSQEDGQPIIGAAVKVDGTSTGMLTDVNGRFSLTLPAGKNTITVSYLGYESKTVQAKNGMRVFLKSDATALDEVVVTAMGISRQQKTLGYSAQTLDDAELTTGKLTDVTGALAGKVAGLVTSQTSGAPGADDMQLFIRGRASFAGDNQPLVMVDGIERPFSQIAPDDIENISVLKDASATAVYGVRGANGVILVTTKRGKDQKPTVSLTANWQWSSPTRKDSYLNSYESVKLLEEALANDGMASQYSAHDIDMFRKSVNGELSGTDAMLYPNVDWYDTVLRKSAPAQRYNVNVQGGTKRMRYYVSAEYYDQSGLFKNFSEDKYGNESNQSYNRIGFRSNLDFQMTKDFTFSVNFGTRFEERRGPNSNEPFDGSYSQIFYGLNHMPGWKFPVSYEVDNGDGTMKTLYAGNSQYQDNPVGRLAKAGFYRATNTISETNFIADYKMDWVTPGLSAKATTVSSPPTLPPTSSSTPRHPACCHHTTSSIPTRNWPMPATTRRRPTSSTWSISSTTPASSASTT